MARLTLPDTARRLAAALLASLAVSTGLASPALAAPESAPALKYPRLHEQEARSRSACEAEANRLFVSHQHGTECIAYYATEGGTPSQPVVLFFEGDVPVEQMADQAGLAKGLAAVRGYMQRMAGEMGVRYVFVARPGVFGSSGSHGERRKPAEVYSMNAAVDALKARLGVERLVLAGQSGGSTVIASLMALGRRDISCAVLGSGLFDVGSVTAAAYNARTGKSITAAAVREVLFDPSVKVGRVARIAERRVFVVGDPADSRTPFAQQRQFSEHLSGSGHHAVLVETKAKGALNHGVAHLAIPAAGVCALGSDDTTVATVISHLAKR